MFLFYTAAGSKTRWSRGRYFEMAAAYSLDGGKTFEKYSGNPVVPHITFMNRDPKVVWEPQGENWVMFYLFGTTAGTCCFTPRICFTGRRVRLISLYTAAECPDLFYLPLDGDPSQGRWVLVGLHGHLSGGPF